MLTSKQRSYLKSFAVEMDDIIHVGKDGINENLVKQVNDALEARELIKGKLLQNCMSEVREVAEGIAKQTKSEVVQVIGRKFVLFRQRKKESFYQLPR